MEEEKKKGEEEGSHTSVPLFLLLLLLLPSRSSSQIHTHTVSMAGVWMEEEIGFPLDLETLPATVFFLNPTCRRT